VSRVEKIGGAFRCGLSKRREFIECQYVHSDGSNAIIGCTSTLPTPPGRRHAAGSAGRGQKSPGAAAVTAARAVAAAAGAPRPPAARPPRRVARRGPPGEVEADEEVDDDSAAACSWTPRGEGSGPTWHGKGGHEGAAVAGAAAASLPAEWKTPVSPPPRPSPAAAGGRSGGEEEGGKGAVGPP